MEGLAYIYAWLIYLLAALGLTCVFWRMTRGMKLRRSRRTLRSIFAVVLFTPINIGQGALWLAPAFLVGAYDWVLGDYLRAQIAGIYIAAAFMFLILLILLESVMRRLLHLEYGK